MKSSITTAPKAVHELSSAGLAWILFLVPLVVGCSEAKVPVVPVSGKITVNKEVPVGAEIVLHAKGHTLPEGVSPVGRVAEDGTFQVSIYEQGEGVPAGEYVATVQWFKIGKAAAGEDPVVKDVVPKKYRDPKTSPIAVTVKNEPTQLDPIVIH